MIEPDAAALDWLRLARGAEIYEREDLSFPVVEFDASSGPVRIVFRSTRTADSTCLVADLPASHFEARMEPLEDPESEDFNDRYGLDTNSREIAAEWLTDPVRAAITEIDPAFVEISGNVLVVQFDGWRVDRRELEWVLQRCDTIRRAARDVKSSEHNELNRQLAKVVKSFDGELLDDARSELPTVRLRSELDPAYLTLEMDQALEATGLPTAIAEEYCRRGGTAFSAQVAGAQNLKIVPQRFWHLIPSLFTGRDFRVGDPDFDRHFMIKPSSEESARALLSERFRRHVMDLHEVEGSRPLFDVSGGVLHIIKDEYLPVGEGIALTKFLSSCMGLLGCFEMDVAAVQLVDTSGARGVCRVCLAPIESNAVSCSTCGTPHHRECWDYLARCSTFGCASTRAFKRIGPES